LIWATKYGCADRVFRTEDDEPSTAFQYDAQRKVDRDSRAEAAQRPDAASVLNDILSGRFSDIG